MPNKDSALQEINKIHGEMIGLELVLGKKIHSLFKGLHRFNEDDVILVYDTFMRVVNTTYQPLHDLWFDVYATPDFWKTLIEMYPGREQTRQLVELQQCAKQVREDLNGVRRTIKRIKKRVSDEKKQRSIDKEKQRIENEKKQAEEIRRKAGVGQCEGIESNGPVTVDGDIGQF